MAKFSFGDTLQCYFYVENSVNYRDFNFYVKNDRFEYLSGLNSGNLNFIFTPMLMFFADSLAVIDTIHVRIRESYFTLYKYEFANPPVDGAGCSLFCENFGLVGFINYAWGSRYVLTKWNNLDIEEEVKNILQKDSENRFFLNRNKTLYNYNNKYLVLGSDQ